LLYYPSPHKRLKIKKNENLYFKSFA